MSYSDQATGIIIKKIDYSNTSVIFHLLSSDKGVIHFLAKGAKSKKSSFAGKLEFFQTIVCHYFKQGSSDLYLLKECSYVDEFRIMKDNINLFFIGSHMLETISALQFDDDDASIIYQLITAAFRSFSDKNIPDGIILAWYLIQLLSISGFPPRICDCLITKQPLRETVYPISHPYIGFSNRIPQGSSNPLHITRNEVGIIESLSQIHDCGLLNTIHADEISLSRILATLGLFVKGIVGRELKTYKSVKNCLGINNI